MKWLIVSNNNHAFPLSKRGFSDKGDSLIISPLSKPKLKITLSCHLSMKQ